jgi:peptidoglycan/LPS O-acetylase OafA/YrhL
MTATSRTDSPAPTVHPAAPRHLAGLDGLRGVAVLAVIAYHLFPAGLPGGFLGVDVFFVISGFLITYLLITEHDRLGHIRLARFWVRRARRLLPALAATVLVCGTIAATIGGDTLVGIGRQVLGATTFSSNWIAAFTGESYFSADTPDLFRNFWSLAVEEQFYLIWPLALVLLLRFRKTSVRLGVMALLSVSSAAEMALIFRPGADASRVYYGTDTHSFGLALGTVLALWLARPRTSDEGGRTRAFEAFATRRLPLAGLLSLFAVLAGMLLLHDTATATYRGGILVVSLATAVVIWSATVPASRLGRSLDVAPLRVIGERSYGIYLWHWPLYVLVTAAFGAGQVGQESPFRLPIILVTLAATGAVATVSYRFLEQPIRRIGLRRTARHAWQAVRRPREHRLTMIVVTATAVCAAATVTGIVHAPSVTRVQALVERGEAALARQATPRTRTPHRSLRGRAHTGPLTRTGTASGAAQDPGDAAEAADPAPQAIPPSAPPSRQPPPLPWQMPQIDGERPLPSGDEITALGDSVMLASAPALTAAFPGIAVDAEVSRQMNTAPGIVASLRSHDELRPVLLIGLGTNGAIAQSTLDRIAATAGPQRRLVFVTVQAPRSWSAEVNDTLDTFAATHPDTVTLARWSEAIAGHLDLLAPDRIHPGAAGGVLYANTVRTAMQTLVDKPAEDWFAERSKEGVG